MNEVMSAANTWLASHPQEGESTADSAATKSEKQDSGNHAHRTLDRGTEPI